MPCGEVFTVFNEISQKRLFPVAIFHHDSSTCPVSDLSVFSLRFRENDLNLFFEKQFRKIRQCGT